MRATAVFVTEINSRLIIRECRLGAPLHKSAADASSDTRVRSQHTQKANEHSVEFSGFAH